MSRNSKKYWQRGLGADGRGVKPMLMFMLLGLLTLGGVKLTQVHATQAQQRPLSDFINAQGTTNCFTPPAPAQIGASTTFTNQTTARFALFDYTGLTARYLFNTYGISLGTTVSGSVTERPLADGRAEVTVNLHTNNALAWATTLDLSSPLDPQFNSNPLTFGSRAQDVATGATPALGDSHLRVVFKNTAPGAPLPDLICINAGPGCPTAAPCPAGFEIDFLSVQENAAGPLRAASGLGPDGTPGRLIVDQIGLIKPAIANGFKGALVDAFPVENIELRRIGR
jgi:hypothetical protein